MRSKTKTKSVINKLESGEGELTKNDQETANVLNNYFASVFTKENTENIPQIKSKETIPAISHIEITNEKIIKAIDKLKESKSQGPDNIHPKTLKETKNEIIKPLKIIYEKSSK